MRARVKRSPILAFLLCLLLVNAQTQTQAPRVRQLREQMPNAPILRSLCRLRYTRRPRWRFLIRAIRFDAYAPSQVPEPNLANSPRLQQLIRDGKLYISLQDAIALALENSLDLAIARYNLPIADTDILRTKAGGVLSRRQYRRRAGHARAEASAALEPEHRAPAPAVRRVAQAAQARVLPASCSPRSASERRCSPTIPSSRATSGLEHLTQPLANLQIYGVPQLHQNTTVANVNYSQAFPTGTSFSFEVDNNRQTTNSIFSSLTPQLGTYYRVTFSSNCWPDLALGPNLRFSASLGTTRRFPTSPLRARSSPPSLRSPTSIGTW